MRKKITTNGDLVEGRTYIALVEMKFLQTVIQIAQGNDIDPNDAENILSPPIHFQATWRTSLGIRTCQWGVPAWAHKSMSNDCAARVVDHQTIFFWRFLSLNRSRKDSNT